MEFNQPTYKEEYGKTIARIISLWFYDYLFEPCFRILDGKTVENDNDILREALQNGYIYYQEGAFYSKTGKFANAVALALEKIGAKYNRYKKAYVLADVMLPIDLVWAIRTIKAQTAERVAGILGYFTLFEANLLTILSKLALDTAVETILQDMQSRMRKEFAKKKIPMISMPLDSFQEEEFAKLYTENMYYWVKKFTEKEIKEMRQTLGKMVLQGKSRVTIAEYLEKTYKKKVAGKALFLARNETGIALSAYQILTLKKEGFKYFKWHVIRDGRERELHRELGQEKGNKYGINGTNIYEIDNPPIIYKNEKTGQEERGFPKQTYNCYSRDTEVLTKDGFKLIKDVKIGETVASVNPETKIFEWVTCTNKVAKKVDKIFDINSNIFDLSVSKDHVFFYYKKRYLGKAPIKDSQYPVFTQGVENLSKGNTEFLATTENWAGQKTDFMCGIPIDIFCKFMGYYLSDGSVDKRSEKNISIAQQNNQKMYDELKPYMHIRQGKDKLYITNKELYSIVEPLGYSYEKRIPEVIKNLPIEQIRIFLNAFASCDGRCEKISYGFNGKIKLKSYNQYFTTSPKMMADLVECIYKTNMSCSVYKIANKGKEVEFKNGTYTLNYDLYIINEMKTKNRHIREAKIIEKPYNDFVYDIEVEKNHTILIKKGKSIHWNSNCRCHATGWIDKEFIQRRREIVKNS